MSKAQHLKKEKIERLEYFLKKDSVADCCKKFKVNTPAFREAISNTTKALHDFYVKGEEHFIGKFSSLLDISLNKDVVLKWIERHNNREKPNSIYSDTIEANEDEIMRAIVAAYPPKNQTQSYYENSLRIEGALWVLRNYKVTNKSNK